MIKFAHPVQWVVSWIIMGLRVEDLAELKLVKLVE